MESEVPTQRPSQPFPGLGHIQPEEKQQSDEDDWEPVADEPVADSDQESNTIEVEATAIEQNHKQQTKVKKTAAVTPFERRESPRLKKQRATKRQRRKQPKQ